MFDTLKEKKLHSHNIFATLKRKKLWAVRDDIWVLSGSFGAILDEGQVRFHSHLQSVWAPDDVPEVVQ